MPDTWSREAVHALAPDAGSLKAALGLANARQWSRLEQAERAIWGEIKGSGANPYLIRVDLGEPAFKCSCPSRKFPCKHGLALLMVYADAASAFKAATPPEWVSEWLASRAERNAKRAAKPQVDAAPADPAAQAKRIAAREARIAQGLDELALWLRDSVRIGLARARQQPGFATNIAAHLVDAQAPGLAREVALLGDACASGEGWEVRALDRLGRLALLVRTYREQDRLPAPLREDVRALAGWTRSQDEVLASERIDDRWHVLGHVLDEDGPLTARRTWLKGERTGRPALILTFAAGGQPIAPALACGHAFSGALAFYPGASGLRALIAASGSIEPVREYPRAASIADALDAYADALARAPWVDQWPFCLASVRLNGQWLVGVDGSALPIARRFVHNWHWLAASGGAPVDVAGEWDGTAFTPLTMACAERIYEFTAGATPALVPMNADAA